MWGKVAVRVAEKASGVYTLYIDVIWEVGECGISLIRRHLFCRIAAKF